MAKVVENGRETERSNDFALFFENKRIFIPIVENFNYNRFRILEKTADRG
jgi:hypothetical protein